MSEYLNPLAELNTPDSGKFINPKDAYLLKDGSNFYCPDNECSDPNRILIPSRSKLGNHFFRHNTDYSHNISPQTLLHKLAIKWFVDKKYFEIPSYQFSGKSIKQQILKIDKTQTELEYRILELIIPDVTLTTTNKFHFAIEIVVTNDISEEKRKLIEKFDLPTIRIDLSQFYKLNKQECCNHKFIEAKLDKLLNNIQNKSWVAFPSIESLNELEIEEINDPIVSIPMQGTTNDSELNNNDNSNIWSWIVGVFIIILVVFVCKRKKKRH